MRYLMVEILNKFPELEGLIFKTRVFKRNLKQHEFGTISPVFAHAMSSSVTVLINNIEEALLQNKSIDRNKLKSSYQAALKLKQLLSINRQEPNGWYNLKLSLDHVIAIFNAKHSPIIFAHYEELNILIKGNQIVFEEAILCLLNNAAESYLKTSRSRVVLIYGFVRSKSIQIIIEDFGTGMNYIAQKVALISGISYKKQGLGIGLSFANRIVEQLGGKIEFESRLDKGTKLIISFPVRNTKRIRNLE